jgi:hypothetical protein
VEADNKVNKSCKKKTPRKFKPTEKVSAVKGEEKELK